MRGTVIADASWCPKTRSAGWAVWLTPDEGERVKRYGQFKELPKTSNEAELWALLNGMHFAYSSGVRILIAQTDCLAAFNSHMKGTVIYPHISENLPGLSVTFRHVKGHTSTKDKRSYVNRWCDMHARAVMRAMRDRKPPPYGTLVP